MNREDELDQWVQRLIAQAHDRSAALDQAWQAMENAGLLNRVVLRRYQCHKCHRVLGIVAKIGGRVLCRTRDYKFSQGMNEKRSVAAARRKNTLDGERHWPGHTFDVSDLAEWGSGAGMDMNCWHVTRTVLAAECLADVQGIEPGHPGAPILL